jgi:molybdopterin synthase sulfur carrier subunit
VKILFYGRIADAIGRELQVESSAGCLVADLRKKLTCEHPAAAQALSAARARTCVGDTLVEDTYLIGPEETVEFLPPVSGG